MNSRVVTLAFVAALLPLAAVAAPVDLVDLTPKHWASGAVTRTVQAGILAGFPDHTFRGWKPVSRYELIGSISKLLPPQPAADGPQTQTVIQDLPTNHWALPAVQQMQSLSLGGALWSDGQLSGDRPASRFDLAYAAAELGNSWSLFPPLSPGFSPFADVPTDHWAAPAVRQVQQKGLMGAGTDTRFNGEAPIDRYTLAAVLDRLMSEIAAAKTTPASAAAAIPAPAL